MVIVRGQDDVQAKGSFKRVARANLPNGQNIAVATCRTGESLEDEAALMQRLGRHPHLVRFFGLSVDPLGVQHLVTEWAR